MSLPFIGEIVLLPTWLEPLAEIAKRLRREGFPENFELTGDAVVNTDTRVTHRPEDVTICSIHREEGDSNPDDESVLFAVRAPDGSAGIIVTGYGRESGHADTIRRLGTAV